ncbi:hypothetical protein DFP72DRAFT_1062816 [Ephemerocybe angulata]|uniref:Pyridoxamine 5'-phosphate oxidase putative domain-containing protein n=1 Tax=Ephemerocybe angulata TaxID=980116 RepID=A0A8H6M9W5_9AGAR|nr:hypothetical protein DFP72DRAFT_1062816 [Tulosesus angulatus]
MGETWPEIPASLIEWIKKQHMFWVASAPLSPNGHVNISPKGVAGTFHVESPTRVWYEDLSGSGAETIAHIRENGRVTILFNAFDGPPRITRLYGIGSFYELGTPEYDALLPAGTRQPGSRAIVVVDVYKVGTTCGYSVPYYSFVGHRTPLLDWAARKEAVDLASSKAGLRPPPADPTLAPSTSSAGILSSEISLASTSALTDRTAEPHPKGLLAWWRDRNAYSLDGLPALDLAFRQPPASLGGHQPVRKARQPALNEYPPSKKPVDDDSPIASDIRSRRHWMWPFWLIHWVRWFLPIQIIASHLTSSNTFAGSPRAKTAAKAIPDTTTVTIHGEEIHEPSSEAPEVDGPPVSWGVRGDSASSRGPKRTREPFWWTSQRTQISLPSLTVLLGYGLAFLLGMIFMMFYGEVQASPGTSRAAAIVFRERRLLAFAA